MCLCAPQTLNNAYAQTGVAFQLAATTRTTNSVWYYAQQNSQDWVDMTNALHQGTMADLNLYSLNLTFPLLGWSQFPWWYADSPLQVRGPHPTSRFPLLKLTTKLKCVSAPWHPTADKRCEDNRTILSAVLLSLQMLQPQAVTPNVLSRCHAGSGSR